MKKQNALHKMVSFIFRYLWLLCLVLICIDLIGNIHAAKELIQTSSRDTLIAVQSEIEAKIDMTKSWLEGAANSDIIQDDSLSLEERAKSLSSYADSMDLILAGVIDKDGLGSCNFNYTPISFSEEAYFKTVMETGKTVITNVCDSDIYGVRNFSIAVPVKNPDCKAAMVVATINFDNIDAIIRRKVSTDSFHYLVVDKDQVVIANPTQEFVGQNLAELDKRSFHFTSSTEEFYNNLRNSRSGNHVSVFEGVIYYTPYRKIANTDWTLILRMDIAKVCRSMVIIFLVKAALYILIFLTISVVGNKYVGTRLEPVSNVIDQVSKLNDDINQLEHGKKSKLNLSDIVETSHKGLRDELTGLATRTLFHQILKNQMETTTLSLYTAIYYIDMDNLKEINDGYGHQSGDGALIFLGKQLQSIAQEYNCNACRYGGDEFLLLAQNFNSVEELEQLAKVIISRLNSSVQLNGKTIDVHASLGAAVYPIHSKDINEIIQYADKALYNSKQNNKGGYTFYQPGKI